MNSSHYHITVKCTANELEHISKLVKGKPTSIDLYKDSKSQIDRMITKYHRSLSVLKQRAFSDIEKIQGLGFQVARLKIEEVVPEILESDVGKYHYLEGHIKIKSNVELKHIDGFILSGNNAKTNTRFYNFRVRTLEDYHKVVSGFNQIENIVETEFERVILDTNEQHDRWWG